MMSCKLINGTTVYQFNYWLESVMIAMIKPHLQSRINRTYRRPPPNPKLLYSKIP